MPLAGAMRVSTVLLVIGAALTAFWITIGTRAAFHGDGGLYLASLVLAIYSYFKSLASAVRQRELEQRHDALTKVWKDR